MYDSQIVALAVYNRQPLSAIRLLSGTYLDIAHDYSSCHVCNDRMDGSVALSWHDTVNMVLALCS